MSESPSASVPPSGTADITSGLIAMPAPATTSTMEADVAALAHALDEGAPIDLLLAGRDLVELPPNFHATLYAADPVPDWSAGAFDGASLSVAMDAVFAGSYGESFHVGAEHPAFSARIDGAFDGPVPGDALVDFGSIGGGRPGLAPVAFDAPTHIDLSADSGWRVDLAAQSLHAPELSWLAGGDGGGAHVGETWAWDESKGAYVFDHYV